MSNILIQTQTNEKTTDLVLEYLFYFSNKFIRIHDEDIINDFTIYLGDKEEKVELHSEKRNLNFKIEENSRFGYRRGNFSYRFPFKENMIHPEIKKYLIDEWEVTKSFLHENFSYLGNYNKEKYSNKLLDLKIAKSCGIKIPSTIVTTKLEELKPK